MSSEKPLAELLDELDALRARAVDVPYFVSGDTADDCPEHRNSGLALVDTGRSGDWPVARLCEWHTANFIAELANAYPRLVRELRERMEREYQERNAVNNRLRLIIQQVNEKWSSEEIRSGVRSEIVSILNDYPSIIQGSSRNE